MDKGQLQNMYNKFRIYKVTTNGLDKNPPIIGSGLRANLYGKIPEGVDFIIPFFLGVLQEGISPKT